MSRWELKVKDISNNYIEMRELWDSRPSPDQITKITHDYLASINILKGIIVTLGPFIMWLEEVRDA